MERIVARKLARDLEDRKILRGKGWGSDQDNAHRKTQLHLRMTCRKDSRGKNKTVAAAINPEDAYNIIQFKPLIDLLMQYGVSLTLTRWVAGALPERTVVMQLGNWSSAPHQLTTGPSQGSPLSPVLFNVYTKGLADLNQNGSSKSLTHTGR